ncbi:MAG TPA: hypothetical protein VEP49_06410 [Acidimicrobiia bacterium]|nr:hypothetical protein [Acidimicrobiia bacterium]
MLSEPTVVRAEEHRVAVAAQLVDERFDAGDLTVVLGVHGAELEEAREQERAFVVVEIHRSTVPARGPRDGFAAVRRRGLAGARSRCRRRR